MIKIDGAFGSGGGQILRTTCALSAVTKKPCQVFNIRKQRPKAGLMNQHLLGIQALAHLCNGRLEGDYLGSQEIAFYPGQNYRERFSVNIPTAGSITLVLQTLIPPALFSPFPIKIIFDGGATDTFFSPTFDHFQFVFLKILKKIGVNTEINVLKRGYYPEGGAKFEVKIYPATLKPLSLLEKGKLEKILIISGASEFLKTKKVAERQVAGAKEILGKLKLPIEEKIGYYQTQCPGSQICLIAEFENTVLGSDNLGKLGKSAEEVGKEAALNLLKEEKTGACLDKYLADQILPYLALTSYQKEAFGLGLTSMKSTISVSEITSHCKSNIWVIEKFLEGEFEIKNNLISWLPKV